VVFASPRKLPRPSDLEGRVVVLDIAFAADGIGKGFDKTTGKFIEQLGARLAAWVDHHDHPRHVDFARDERFTLCTKAEHGACPEMIDEDMVRLVGPVDTIVCHFDVDGMYAAAKWMLGGREPYVGADDDARCIDTRIGEPGPKAVLVDKALRAQYRDENLKQRAVRWLILGQKDGVERDSLDAAAAQYDAMAANSKTIAGRYRVEDDIAQVTIKSGDEPFDKTELLLLGQKVATVAVVVDSGNVSIAAPFDSGLDFVELLELGGGMPTRVNVPRKRLESSIEKIVALLAQRA
jgi:hypothetical protein